MQKLTTALTAKWLEYVGVEHPSRRTSEAPRRQKRRIYVIDKRVQLRLAMQFAFIALVAGIMALFTYHVISSLHGLAPSDLPAFRDDPRIRWMVWGYGLLALLINAGLFLVITLFFTHRIAGPQYRIVQSLKQIAEGDLTLQIRLRRGDHLKEIAEAVNGLTGALSDSMSELDQAVQILKTHRQDGGEDVAEQQLAVIEAIVNRYMPKDAKSL